MPKTADYMKNRSEFALIFRKAVRSEGGKRARWTRADGGMLLDQFARLHPEIQPANSNVWENYVPPGRHESLHDEKGARVRPLAEKSRALCEMILARFCPCDRQRQISHGQSVRLLRRDRSFRYCGQANGHRLRRDGKRLASVPAGADAPWCSAGNFGHTGIGEGVWETAS